ncbi:MAG: DUF2339 domain-containing protein [Bdellovibrionales bacterium]
MQPSLEDLNQRLQNLELEFQKLQKKHQGLVDYLLGSTVKKKPSNSADVSSASESKIIDSSSLSSLESNIDSLKASIRILPLVAVICFLLAGVFMIGMAVESGWLTPFRQLSLLTLLAAALTAAGRSLSFLDRQYRSYLSAAGVSLMYMAAYSSHLYFQLLPAGVSTGLALGVSAVSMTLFHYHRNELFPVLTSVGTYLVPLLLGAKQDLIFHSSYFVIWALAFSAASTFLKTRTLTLTASYLGLGVFTLLHTKVTDPAELGTVILVQVLQFGTFAYGIYNYSMRNREPLTSGVALGYLPILLFFYGTTYFFLDRLNPDLAPWLSLCFAAFVYLLYQKAQRGLPHLESESLVFGFLTVVLFHSGYLQILPSSAKPWLLPLILLGTYVAEQKSLLPRTSKILTAGLWLIGLLEFGKISFELLSSANLKTVVPALVTVGLGAFGYLRGGQRFQDQSKLLLGGLHILSILSLYRLMHEGGSLAVSLAWGLYSVVVLGLGYRQRDAALAKSSLLVLLVATLKALVYDASRSASSVRIMSLLVTGLVLYGAGFLFKKIESWPKSKAPR